MANGYPGVDPGGYGPMQLPASGAANFLTGALPGFDRMAGMLAALPMIRQRAEEMERERAMRGLQTLAEAMKLPRNMRTPYLTYLQQQQLIPMDQTLVKMLSRADEEQSMDIANLLTSAGADPTQVQFAQRNLGDINRVVEMYNALTEQRRRQAEGQRLSDLLAREEEPPPSAPTAPRAAAPAIAPPALAPPPPPAPSAEPAPAFDPAALIAEPPGTPELAPAPGPALEPAPAPGSPPMESRTAPEWQRDPDYMRARANADRALARLNQVQRNYTAAVRAMPDRAKELINPIFERQLANAKEALDAAMKDLNVRTPEAAGHQVVRDEITGKHVIRIYGKQGQRLGDVGAAPFDPKTEAGKLEADFDQLKRLYGSDSPEATRFRESMDFTTRARKLWETEAEAKIEALKQGDPKDVRQMREEFINLSKPYREAVDGYTRIQVGGQTDDLAGDLALIYGYAKMLDPTGAVREGDYNSIANNPGIPGFLADLWRGLSENRRIGQANRQKILAAATNLYQQYETTHRQHASEYRRLAGMRGYRVDEVVPNFIPPRATPGAAPTPGAPVPNPAGPGLRQDSLQKREDAVKKLDEAFEKLENLRRQRRPSPTR
jgi:hypothetical protein